MNNQKLEEIFTKVLGDIARELSIKYGLDANEVAELMVNVLNGEQAK